MRYSLVDEPWIRVLADAGLVELSLGDVLVGAHGVVRLAPDDPLVEAAAFRLLLAVVIDAHGDQIDPIWPQRFREGGFDPNVIRHYLATHRESFDLFHAERPFYQVGDLAATSGEVKSTLLLMPEIATGNNVPLFSSVTEAGFPHLSPAEAARRLIVCHAFDTAGIKTGAAGDPAMKAGKTTGNPIGLAGQVGLTIPMGRNLFESLMLSWPRGSRDPADLPAWRREPSSAAWETRPPRGILDVLTWQSRRVRLFPEQRSSDVVVTGVVVSAGDRSIGLDAAHEPHAMWRAGDPAKGGMAQRPIRHQPGRAMWRGMSSLLAVDPADGISTCSALSWSSARRGLPRDYALGIRTVGVVYGNQSAVIEDVIDDLLPLPALAFQSDGALLRDVLIEVAQMAESVRQALNNLDDNLRRSRGGEPTPWDKGQRPGERYIAALDRPVRDLLEGIAVAGGDAESDLLLRWELTAWDLAWDVADTTLTDVPPEAFFGRRPEGKRPINQAIAEAYFRGSLKTTLARAADHNERRRQDERAQES